MRVWWVVGLVLCAACARRPPATPADDGAAATVSPPVTLEEFRAAFPKGTTLLLRFTVPERPPLEERWTWTRANADSCTIHTLSCDADGAVLEDEGEEEVAWEELTAHAMFEADRTQQVDSSVDVAAGHFETWLFTVQETADDGTPRVGRYHFDRHRPGPPVLLTREVDGSETIRMELVERADSVDQASARCAVPGGPG